MDQQRIPLLEKLIEHANNKTDSFHVPGHKNGTLFHEEGLSTFKEVLGIDVTELPELDDLHDPVGVIREAEQLAAQLYGVDSTSFLVGGSTVGNLAMLMGTLHEGDVVLVQRNSHQSIIHGLELSGAQPVFLEPIYDDATGLALGITVETVKHAVNQFPCAKALVLTNPTYEGYGHSIKDHVQIAHESGMQVLVDEAHGAHLTYDHQDWPQSAIRAGADVVVQSAHKILPAMTMSSFLHMRGKLCDFEAIKGYLRMLQSSSPSYPLMASLDAARAYLALVTAGERKRLIEVNQKLREQLNVIPQWEVSPQRLCGFLQDPLKIALMTRCEASGFELQKALINESSIYPELATETHVLLTLPLSSNVLNIESFVSRVATAVSSFKPQVGGIVGVGKVEIRRKLTELAFTYKQMKTKEIRFMSWRSCSGWVSAEDIVPYPPGIPLLMKGERIEPFHIDKLEKMINAGTRFQTGREWIERGIKVYK
ncbi:aminotransferase class I/II-fold pyridoxal phosphate-dependent enzyme [Alteribacter populi]|uniref:aminotransferase class I/II-fold pyridoxal phosphate-dependent enzyme n=1 Tax=Alteribacter populi TaxID=2011011 RepID=UPI000BBB3568|nr:aminotransferase class I/II-fold pyridoxal phosphate-dependent enzyme [Alteribacter populi]